MRAARINIFSRPRDGTQFISFWIRLTIIFVSLAAPLHVRALQPTENIPTMAQLVDAEGHPHWPANYSGSIDTHGYSMNLTANGEPRFAPNSTNNTSTNQAPGAQVWTGFGAARHGCSGNINAMVRLPNGDIVVGGLFEYCGETKVNGLARWNGVRWSAFGATTGKQSPILASSVLALAVRGNDVFVGGGVVIKTAEETTLGVARWDGSAWHSLYPGWHLNSSVRSIVVVGTDVYLGGDFTAATLNNNPDQLPDLPMHHIARWDGSALNSLRDTTTPACAPGVTGIVGLNAAVNALATDGTNVFIGGEFLGACDSSSGPGIPANRVIRWNGATWSALGNGAQNGLNGSVKALAYSAGTLYVGGAFDTAGDTPANSVAKWNGTVWTSVGAGADNGIAGTVNTMSVFAGQLYVGGMFRTAGLVSSARVAHWNGVAWSAMGQGVGVISNTDASSIMTVQADAAGVYAAGTITQIPGVDVVGSIAHWNGANWQPLVSPSDATMIDGHVNAFAISGGDLYVAGAITRVGDISVNNIARWNGSAWSNLGSGVDGEVFALAATPSNVYAGGVFTHAGGQPASRAARWDRGAGAWRAMGSGVDAVVHAIAVASDSTVYFGGEFLVAGGIPVSSVAVWNGSAWSALSATASGVCGPVYALARFGSGVYIGGAFPYSGWPSCRVGGNNIVYWTGTSWEFLQPPLAMVAGVTSHNGLPAGSTVNALLVSGSDLYIGGIFDLVDAGAGNDGGIGGLKSVNNIVRWRAGAWDLLSPPPSEFQNQITSMAMFNGMLMVGNIAGYVVNYDERRRRNNASCLLWDRAIPANQQDFNSQINAFAVADDRLYVGGAFHHVLDAGSQGWAAYSLPRLFADNFETCSSNL